MQSLKARYYPNTKKLFIIFSLLCCFFFCRKGLAWPQDAFEATLVLERIDRDCEVDEYKQNKLKFGFDQDCEIVYYPPPPLPPGPAPPSQRPVRYCLKTFIDPNHTKVDGDKLNGNSDYGIEWYKAILPFPEQRACWGVKVLFGDPNNPELATLKLTWSPNALGSGFFKLIRGKHEVLSNKMKDKSEIIINDVENGETIKVEYYKEICSNPRSSLAVICVGGRKNIEGIFSGHFEHFSEIGDKTYKSLLNLIPKENIKYIFYDPRDVDGNKKHDDVDPDRSISQKKRLKEYITEWPVEKWSECLPEPLVLIIYVVNHGFISEESEENDPNINPFITIDPISFDPNNPDEQYLYPKDLKNWINGLEDNLLSHGIYKFEIITIIEACHSNGFLNVLWDDDINCSQMNNNSSKKIFITSAKIEADISHFGTESFSWYFWDALDRAITGQNKVPSYLKYAYSEAESQVSGQSPIFEDCNDTDIFFDDIVDQGSVVLKTPYIKDVEIDSNNIGSNNPILSKPSFLTFKLNIDFDLPIEKVWAIIDPPGCSDKSCRKLIEPWDTKIYDLTGNQCVFQPDYLFSCPGIYKVYFYAKGENSGISIPKFYFFQPNIPAFSDSYEPDNKSEDATIFYEEFQIHSLHDTNDIDWIKLPAIPDKEYEIRFELLCTHPSDPNIFPFQVILSKDGKLSEDNKLDLRTMDDYSYIGEWKNNIHQDPIFVYLRISLEPNINCKDSIPYKISIIIAPIAGENFYIIGKVGKGYRNIVGDLYIFTNSGQRYYPDWFYDFEISQPDYFIFNISFDISSNPHLGLGDNDLGLVDKKNTYLDLNRIIIEPKRKSISDPNIRDGDCDGIMGDDDPDPNHPDIILHPGLNLFRYPLWTSFPSMNLSWIFYDPYVISSEDQNKIKRIRILSDQNQKRKWDYYNKDSVEIPLPNNSGCLIHLYSENKLEIPLTSVSNLNDPNSNELGICIKAREPDKLSDYSKINLYEGLNVVSFTGYRVYSVDYPDPNHPDSNYPEIFYDFWIPLEGCLNSYSIIQSLSEPDSYNQSNDPNFTVMRYDNHSGKWESSYSFFGYESGKQFKIKMNEAYLIYSKEEKVDWVPEHKLYKSH